MKKQKTKQLLLEKGAELMQIKGYNNTGIQEIVNACKVPKGSFYFYFESKEYFGLELINHFAAIQLEELKNVFGDNSLSPRDRIETYFSNFFEKLNENDFKGGSLVGNFVQELADVNEMFRQGLHIVTDQVIDCFFELIKEIKPGINNIECRQISELIYFSFEGLVMQAKLSKSTEPLKNLQKIIENFLA